MATIIYTRPSGKEIEVGDTKVNKAFAKEQGWKRKRAAPEPEQTINTELELGDNND